MTTKQRYLDSTEVNTTTIRFNNHRCNHYFLADMGGVTGEIVVVVDVHGIHLVVTTSKNGTYRV